MDAFLLNFNCAKEEMAGRGPRAHSARGRHKAAHAHSDTASMEILVPPQSARRGNSSPRMNKKRDALQAGQALSQLPGRRADAPEGDSAAAEKGKSKVKSKKSREEAVVVEASVTDRPLLRRSLGAAVARQWPRARARRRGPRPKK